MITAQICIPSTGTLKFPIFFSLSNSLLAVFVPVFLFLFSAPFLSFEKWVEWPHLFLLVRDSVV